MTVPRKTVIVVAFLKTYLEGGLRGLKELGHSWSFAFSYPNQTRNIEKLYYYKA